MAVVVSHIASDFGLLQAQVLRQLPLADLVELRLDRLGDVTEDSLGALIGEITKPVIVSAPGPEAHGEFPGDLDARIELLLMASRCGAAFVDIDWRASLELGEVEGKCHRIVSRHEIQGTPADLTKMHEEVRDVLYEGDLIKLVTHAETTEDGLRVLNLVHEIGGGLIGFCSGEAGRFTRVLAPIFGSPFTYASPASMPDAPEPEATAPGQIPVDELLGLFPPGGATIETAIFAVVGGSVAHSFSPHVHGMALKGARLDAVYVALQPESLTKMLELCGHENFRGFSVTAPFKRDAHDFCERRDSATEAAGAANTLARDPAGWRAMNTDVPAVRETITTALEIHGRRHQKTLVRESLQVLVLGTGGAARAAVLAARELGMPVTIAGRRREAAETLAREVGGVPVAWEDIPGVSYDVLVHATPVGSLGHETGDPATPPIPSAWIRPKTLVLDAVYRPIRTPFLLAATEAECTAVPGGEWFVRQAAGQFRIFTQEEPNEVLLRAAFDAALAADQKE